MSGTSAPGIPFPSSSNVATGTIEQQPGTHVPRLGSYSTTSTMSNSISINNSVYPSSDRKKWGLKLSRSPTIRSPIKIDYQLPTTVASVRDGWTATCQSGAVVSGLLAAVAAQMLSLFKAPPQGPNGGQTVLLISCYLAILLNISATIGSFILIDRLGEIGFKSSSKQPHYEAGPVGEVIKSQEQLMIDYNASRMWKPMLYYWLITFFAGIISLVIAILSYVTMQENLAVKFTLWIMVIIHIALPLFFFMWNADRDE